MDERVVHAYDGKTVQGHGGQQGRVTAAERQPRDAGLLVSLKVPSEAMQNANLEFRKENEVMKPKYRKRKEKEREKMFTVEKRRATDKASRWRQFGLSTLQDGRRERRSEETGTESLLHLPEGLQGDRKMLPGQLQALVGRSSISLVGGQQAWLPLGEWEQFRENRAVATHELESSAPCCLWHMAPCPQQQRQGLGLGGAPASR